MSGYSRLALHSADQGAVSSKLGIPHLEESLKLFQTNFNKLKIEQNRICSETLDSSLQEFLDLVNGVQQNDGDLLVHFLSGAYYNQETIDVAIQNATERLVERTQEMAESFQAAARIFEEESNKVQLFDLEMTRFSESLVARVLVDAEDMLAACNKELDAETHNFTRLDGELSNAQARVRDLNQNINNSQQLQSKKETARNISIAVGSNTLLASLII
jgi:hypothetical protein